MSRYIDADKLSVYFEALGNQAETEGLYNIARINKRYLRLIEESPTADVVEVRHDFSVGDFCLYGFADGNKSLAIVEIVKILDDERGIAELKFHKVIKDNTGNGYFHYLLKSGHTMNGSFEYLKNITPKMDGERKEECKPKK